MADDNVGIFRRGLAGWNRDGVEGVLPLLKDDVVANPFPEWPGPDVYHGHDGFRQLAGEWTDNFDEYSWEEERIIGLDDRVVALVHHHGRIKGTGIPMRQQMGTIWTIEDGRVGEVSFFLTWDEALTAAGVDG